MFPSRRPDRRVQKDNPVPCRARLLVELLEARCLLDAAMCSALSPGTYDPSRILVGDVAGQVHQVQLAQGVTVEQALADYRNAPGVAYAEPDYLVHADLTPNDTYYNLQYALNNTGQVVNGAAGVADADIDAPEAWNITTGRTTTVVAVIDTGVDYTHPDLYLNIWINQQEIPTAIRSQLADIDGDGVITFWDLNNAANQGAGKITDLNANGRIDGGDLLNNASGWENGVDDDADGKVDDLIGWNFVNNTNDPLDDNGHGSHTSGTIGAIGNNGTGVVGVNWQVQIAAMKFLNSSGSGAISGAQGGLDLAVKKGILISNNSWGGGGFSSPFNSSLISAAAAGHVFVAAAGNSAVNIDTSPSYPASYNVANVVAVAATNSSDQIASFSNYGVNTVDIAAPGVSIASTYSNGGYVYLDGTSMATPHVAGVAALVRSQDPTLGYAEVISRILNNADAIPGLTSKVAGGRRLNAFGAVNGAPPADVTGPRIVSAQPNGSASVSSVRLTFNEAIAPSSFTIDDITNFIGPDRVPVTVTGVNVVAGSGNKQFDVTFAGQTAAGGYGFDVGPDVRDTAGNPMDQDTNGVNGETTDVYHATFTVTSTFIFSNNTPASIRDFVNTYSYITINQDISVADLDIKLNITHTWDGDLYIALRHPDGTTVLLANHRGGAGDNFTNTLFNDEAASSIVSGVAPFAGAYRPEGALSAFDGKNARGAWRLRVYDGGSADIGTLNSWSLIITQAGGAAGQSIGGGNGADDGGDNLMPLKQPTVDGLLGAFVSRSGVPIGGMLEFAPAVNDGDLVLESASASATSASQERIVVGTVAESESQADILDRLFAEEGTFDAADAEWL